MRLDHLSNAVKMLSSGLYTHHHRVFTVLKEEQNVHEEISLEPLTDYSKFKAQCEKDTLRISVGEFLRL